MKNRTLALLLLLISLPSAGPARAQGPSSRVTGFVNVSVIPMDRERVLRDQTVVVRDGLVSEVGDARRVRVPPGALRIDGAAPSTSRRGVTRTATRSSRSVPRSPQTLHGRA